MITLKLPESLKRFSKSPCLALNIQNISELESAIRQVNPALAQVMFEGPQQLSGFLNLYINQQVLRLDQANLTLADQQEIEIITAFSGG